MASCGVPPHTPDIPRLLLHFLSVPRRKQLLNMKENNKNRFYKVPHCKISGLFLDILRDLSSYESSEKEFG